MRATTEMEIKISDGRIISADITISRVCKPTVVEEAVSEETEDDVT